MPQRILITGGAGFLGSHLCDRMIERGDHVICLDNLQTGRPENIQHLKGRKNFRFIKHDVIEPIDIKVDRIFNLACAASPPKYQADPVHTMKTCVLGAINMLELARTNHARIVHASTSEVYGDPTPEHHPQSETYRGNVNPIGMRACYDEGKRAAETLMADYRRAHNVDARVVRIFNTYGPRMDPWDGRVVTNFIRQALTRQPLTIYGKGLQTRSFCYVDDLVEGLVRMMDARKPPALIKDDADVGPINLGNPGEFTIQQLADLVLQLTASKSKIVRKPIPPDDPKHRRPDITRAKHLLKWQPTVQLREGLERTIAWFKTADLRKHSRD